MTSANTHAPTVMIGERASELVSGKLGPKQEEAPLPEIGIVGAGTAGLHLALLLQQRGLQPTLYAERSADEVRDGRLPNTVAHHHHTRTRERELRVNHWDGDGPSYGRHWHYVGGEQPLEFPGGFTARAWPSTIASIFRSCSRTSRSAAGTCRSAWSAPPTSTGWENVTIWSSFRWGRGGLADRFAPISGRSPFDGPQRALCAGLYAGVAYTDPLGVTFAISPGHGEIIEIPIQTFEGNMTTLLFEAIPGGDLEALSHASYADDPSAFETLVLEKLQAHFPPIFARADTSAFSLTRPAAFCRAP